MWYKEYRDYPPDAPLKRERVTQGKGLTGCEMREFNGWGHTHHQPPKKKKGIAATLLEQFFSLFSRK